MTDAIKNIVHVSDLSTYFFDKLHFQNSRSLCPVPEEMLLYSSQVLNKYSLSSEFFEMKNGKVSSKILGLEALSARAKSMSEQKKIYKDIADTALVLTGFFGESINKKIIDKSYYIQLGQMAYSKVHSLDVTFLDMPHFYKRMSSSFPILMELIKSLSCELNFQEQLSDNELLIRGIIPGDELKVS